MVEVGMEVDVEVGMAEETKKEEEERNNGSSEVVRLEKFLPQMVLRVLLVEADDSTRQIIAALLRKCSYRGFFFTFPFFIFLISSVLFL